MTEDEVGKVIKARLWKTTFPMLRSWIIIIIIIR